MCMCVCKHILTVIMNIIMPMCAHCVRACTCASAHTCISVYRDIPM